MADFFGLLRGFFGIAFLVILKDAG